MTAKHTAYVKGYGGDPALHVHTAVWAVAKANLTEDDKGDKDKDTKDGKASSAKDKDTKDGKASSSKKVALSRRRMQYDALLTFGVQQSGTDYKYSVFVCDVPLTALRPHFCDVAQRVTSCTRLGALSPNARNISKRPQLQ